MTAKKTDEVSVPAEIKTRIYSSFEKLNGVNVRGTKIYNLLSDPEFLGKYGSHKVIGVNVNALTGISILIKEAE